MTRPEKLTAIRKHPYRTTAVAGLAAIVALELTGYAQNSTQPVPTESCLSPVAASDTYVDHDFNLYLTGAFTTGVLAEGKIPDGAYGVVGSFKSPDAPYQEWQHNASDMIKPEAGKIALKFAIGGGDVQFGVQLVAPRGSELCNQAPGVDFTHLDSNNYFHTAGNLPWTLPNPVNGPVNVFGNL